MEQSELLAWAFEPLSLFEISLYPCRVQNTLSRDMIKLGSYWSPKPDTRLTEHVNNFGMSILIGQVFEKPTQCCRVNVKKKLLSSQKWSWPGSTSTSMKTVNVMRWLFWNLLVSFPSCPAAIWLIAPGSCSINFTDDFGGATKGGALILWKRRFLTWHFSLVWRRVESDFCELSWLPQINSSSCSLRQLVWHLS